MVKEFLIFLLENYSTITNEKFYDELNYNDNLSLFQISQLIVVLTNLTKTGSNSYILHYKINNSLILLNEILETELKNLLIEIYNNQYLAKDETTFLHNIFFAETNIIYKILIDTLEIKNYDLILLKIKNQVKYKDLNLDKNTNLYKFELNTIQENEIINTTELNFNRNELLEFFFEGSNYIKIYPEELVKKIRKEYSLDLLMYKKFKEY